jgi:hypothetical protein
MGRPPTSSALVLAPNCLPEGAFSPRRGALLFNWASSLGVAACQPVALARARAGRSHGLLMGLRSDDGNPIATDSVVWTLPSGPG